MSAPRSPSTRIVVAATFPAESLGRIVAQLLESVGIDTIVTCTPYNQVAQQLLDPTSALARNDGGVNLVLVLLDGEADTPGRMRDGAGSDTTLIDALIEAIQAKSNAACAVTVVASCPALPDVQTDPIRRRAWQQTEDTFVGAFAGIPGIVVLRAGDLLRSYDIRHYYDEYAHRLADIPYTQACVAAMGLNLARAIHARLAPPRKVIVLDCDNTLWVGSCAEDGLDGIVIDEPHADLQRFIVRQKNAGMLLCLCSKNDEADVWNVFDNHPGMTIRRDDIVAARINWTAKPENVCALADELGLALESFIFIDDDPLECARMQARVPQAVTVQLPSEEQQIVPFLESMWVFDRVDVTDADRQRTLHYRTNRERDRVKASARTVDEFVAMLDVRVSIQAAARDDLLRMAQLTLRTTQWNCTLRRRSESELHALLRDEAYDVLSVKASDRYGDYGLVGVLVFRCANRTLSVDTCLLSCRVLGRNIERRMLAEAEAVAKRRGLAAISVPFVPGPRNHVARDFLDTLESPWIRHDIGGGSIYVQCFDSAQDALTEMTDEHLRPLQRPGAASQS